MIRPATNQTLFPFACTRSCADKSCKPAAALKLAFPLPCLSSRSGDLLVRIVGTPLPVFPSPEP